MTGGSTSRGSGVLSRAAELEKLHDRSAAMHEKLATAQREEESAQRELAAAQYEMETAESQRREAEDAVLLDTTELDRAGSLEALLAIVREGLSR